MLKNYSKNFWLLAIGVLLFMTSFNLIIPELNGIMERLNAGDKKGLVFILFSIGATVSRPISGKLSDTVGRKMVMYVGIFLGIISCIFYPSIESLFLFLSLRLLHGFAAGFLPTGATAMVTDLLPIDKRNQGMGIWGVFISLGFGVGQILSTPIIKSLGYNALFFTASLLALFAGVLLLKVRETLPIEQYQGFNRSSFKLKWEDIIEPSVRPSAIVMFLSAACAGFVFVVTPDMTSFLGIENKGVFFGYYTLTTLIIRLLSSKISDKIGNRKTLIVAMLLLGTSMLLLAITQSTNLFICSALLYGVASGISSPTLMAWMADLSNPQRRGTGSGTLFMALEFGFMFGAGISILSYDSTISSVFPTFMIAMALTFLATIYLIWHIWKIKN